MKRLLLIGAVAAFALGGCVSLGESQQDSETQYTLAAIASDTGFLSGYVTPKDAGLICLADAANYKILASTRNVADGVNYAPADNAHAALQADGNKLNPVQCVPVVATPTKTT
jgi:hypothetical protein